MVKVEHRQCGSSMVVGSSMAGYSCLANGSSLAVGGSMAFICGNPGGSCSLHGGASSTVGP